MKKIGIIFQKEMLDNLRDYRSWMTGVFWALFGPLILGAMIMLLGNTIREKVDQSLKLPVSGAENAPNLVAFLKQQDVIIESAPANPKSAVIAGDVNVVLVIPKEYADDFSAGKRATLQLVFDSSRQSAMPDIQRIQTLLNSYDEYIGTLRLSCPICQRMLQSAPIVRRPHAYAFLHQSARFRCVFSGVLIEFKKEYATQSSKHEH